MSYFIPTLFVEKIYLMCKNVVDIFYSCYAYSSLYSLKVDKSNSLNSFNKAACIIAKTTFLFTRLP